MSSVSLVLVIPPWEMYYFWLLFTNLGFMLFRIKIETNTYIKVFVYLYIIYSELPWWLSNKESACLCTRCGFNPWMGKTPWRRKWQPSLVFLSGKFHVTRNLASYSLWNCKRAEHDLATKQQQCNIICRQLECKKIKRWKHTVRVDWLIKHLTEDSYIHMQMWRVYFPTKK